MPEHDRDLRKEAEALGPWFHNLHLPDGTQTAPAHPMGDFPHNNWEAFALRIPRDLSGWRVLDIGCNAGYYSFQMARRGADVVGIDLDERYLKQARWAAEVLGHEDRVRFERKQIYDLAQEEEPFDMVLFLGVFYHLRYPLLGLDIVRDITRRMMVFQTLETPSAAQAERTWEVGFDEVGALDAEGWPRLSFVEHTFEQDPTNWWVANREGVLALLRSAGFDVVNAEGAPFFVCEPSAEEPPHRSWNRSEFLSATGRPWKGHEGAKLGTRAGTLEDPKVA